MQHENTSEIKKHAHEFDIYLTFENKHSSTPNKQQHLCLSHISELYNVWTEP